MSDNALIRNGLCAALLVLAASSLQAQSRLPQTYFVKPGDDILSIAQQIRPPEATVNQVGIALIRLNAAVLVPKSDVRLPAGTVLKVPDLKTILATDAATAERDFNRLLRAEEHYKAALALEKSGNMLVAFTTYVEAAKLGHGLAQVRLGQLYDGDFTRFVQRDLQESARWYEKARKTGVKVETQSGRTVRQGP